MKISILLPYKENFSPSYAGAVSIFINDTMKLVKNEGNLLMNFENAIDKVAEFHNVNKDDIEEYFDNELKEQLGD